MDLINDSLPFGYWVIVDDACDRNYLSLANIMNVPRYITLPFPGTEYSRLPLFFRTALPFLTPPDVLHISGHRAEFSWRGKEIIFSNASEDPYGRTYRAGCVYHIPPSSVTIDHICCGVDQVYIEVSVGNKSYRYLFYKPPYLPILVLHPAYVVESGATSECNEQLSTKNTDESYLNRDAYCFYDLLLLIYSWRVAMVPESQISVDPFSIYTQSIAEIEISHVIFSDMCSTCLPSNPYGGAMTVEEYYEIALTVVLPWACGTPVATLLIGYMLLELAGVFLPFVGALFAFKPQNNYWVLIRPDFPDTSNPLDFYLIHTDMILLAKCGDLECPLYLRYDSNFVPSLDCISLELISNNVQFVSEVIDLPWEGGEYGQNRIRTRKLPVPISQSEYEILYGYDPGFSPTMILDPTEHGVPPDSIEWVVDKHTWSRHCGNEYTGYSESIEVTAIVVEVDWKDAAGNYHGTSTQSNTYYGCN